MSMFSVVQKSASGYSMIPIESKLFSNRNIYIEGEINGESAMLVVKQIHLLNIEDSRKPINLFINSPGGEINAGMMIYDAMQNSPCPVNTVCMGYAYSMGAILVACGSGKRCILPHSQMMIHEPLIANRIGGSASSIEDLSRSLNRTKQEMNAILSKHTGKSREDVEKASEYDHYYTADEAVTFGLCDKIITFDEILKGEE